MIFPVKSPEITIYYHCITTIFWNFQDRPDGHCPGEKIAEAWRGWIKFYPSVAPNMCGKIKNKSCISVIYHFTGFNTYRDLYIYIYIFLGYIISISVLWGYLTTFLVRMSCFTAAWQGQEVVLVRIAVTKLGLL